MHKISTTYRTLIAGLLSAWMMIIVISGVVFMHKEVTSTGEIITHIHPYDFTKGKTPHHHESDAEIQYLNVVFNGTYIQSDFVIFEMPVPPLSFTVDYAQIIPAETLSSTTEQQSRGPPTA